MGGLFSKKRFSSGAIFGGQIYGGLFYMGERSFQGGEGVSYMIHVFSGNLNAVNLQIFPNHRGIFHSRLSLAYFMVLWQYLYLRLIVERFQRLCHVQFPLMLTLNWVIDILFEKLNPEGG